MRFGFVEWEERHNQSRSMEEAECVNVWYAAACAFFYDSDGERRE